MPFPPEAQPETRSESRPEGSPAALLIGLCALASVAACARAGAPAAGPHPRNAILISIDTLRADHLSCYGYGRDTSPTLDALARAGARFADVTSAAPWTLPSHATMLTGLYPSHHGVKSHENRLPASISTLAEELQGHGFQTFAVVNTHNVGAPQFQLGQGFEHFQYISETDEDQHTGRVRTLDMGEVVVSTAEGLLEKRDAAKPFFLFLHFYDVHTDLTPRAEYKARYAPPYTGRLDGRTQQLNGVRNRGETLSEDDLAFLRGMYDAEIRQLDDLLGQFFARLKAHGLSDDTLVVVTSDHGEEFQEHGSVLHGRTQYQELLRVPLILCGPTIPPGTVIATPVHGVDVTPSVLGILGYTPSTPRDGIDLSAAWTGAGLPERVFFSEADQDNKLNGHEEFDTKHMVRKGADKLIANRVTQRVELYDLGADPLEQHDLIGTKRELTQMLQAELGKLDQSQVKSELIPAPTPEELKKLEAMGYAGEGDEK